MEHAEDSSSASAKFTLTHLLLLGAEQVRSGVYKLTPDSGPAFFLRAHYLSLVAEESLVAIDGGLGTNDSLFNASQKFKKGDKGFFTEEESVDILNAALIYSAENAAMTYLGRAEHCRAGLKQKLLKKNIAANAIDSALDYLESVGYLSDLRFAQVWLSSRYIDHAEGRIKLSGELAKRGINRQVAKAALDDFFSRRSEEEICKRAVKKLSKTTYSKEKLIASLRRLGFSSKSIKEAINGKGNS